MQQISYEKSKGWKYRIASPYEVLTPIKIPHRVEVYPFFFIEPWGLLHLEPGYSWDGLSGPMPDIKKAMRASAHHDPYYQAFRRGLLDVSYRPAVDAFFYHTLLEDGVNPVLAWTCYQSVKRFAGYAAKPGTEQPEILTAP